jgi:hypothetical protein
MAFKMNKNKPGSLYNKTAGKNSTSFSKIEDSSSMKRMQDYIIKDGKPVAISTEEFDKRLKQGATFTDIPNIRDLEGMTEQQKRFRGAGKDMGFPDPRATRKDTRRFDQDYYGSYDARKQQEINEREAERKRNQGKKN